MLRAFSTITPARFHRRFRPSCLIALTPALILGACAHREADISVKDDMDADLLITQAMAQDAHRSYGHGTPNEAPVDHHGHHVVGTHAEPSLKDDMALTMPFPVLYPYEPGRREAVRRAVAGWLGRHGEAAAVAVERRSYQLDTGDQLRIFVYAQPSLSRVYSVDDAGRISVPLIGQLKVRGYSPRAVENAVRRRLAGGFVKDPQVTVEVAQFRPYFVMGQVQSAGGFNFAVGLTVREAVALAGGFAARADQRFVKLTRTANGVRGTYEVLLDEPVRPGDTISVPERWF